MSRYCESDAAERPPNIVFILADDLGYRELGCYGQEQIRTPHLDQLAKQGMRLTQHYAGNAVCAPSRCVLLTGKHPGHAWVRDNSEMQPEGQKPIPTAERTIAELLRDAGYATGAFGKWGLGGPGSEGEPLKQGFDRFYGYNCQRHAHSYYPSYLWDDAKRVPLNNKPPVPGHASLDKSDDPLAQQNYKLFQGTDYAPDRIRDQSLDFIRANKDRPFFLYYATVLPHLALHVPEEELQPYLQLSWNDSPFTGRGKGFGYTPHRTPRAAYAGMISRLDRYVGEVLELLDELGLADDTIVVFTSDNGTTHLKEEVDYEFFSSVGELRGLKGSLYEGGIRVPAIVRWPGQVKEGSTCQYVSGFEDWLPTLLTIAGSSLTGADELDGLDLTPVLQGKSQPPRASLYREFAGYGGQQSIRVGDWKAVRKDLRDGNLEVELYNLCSDVGEQNNVAQEQPEVLTRLSTLMQQQHVASKLYPLPGIDPKMNRAEPAGSSP